ncbi:MAG: PP2C family protein-serine/threonine phosphatase [Blastocatellia bacterium]
MPKPAPAFDRRSAFYLIVFLLGAGLLLFIGRGMVQVSALTTWALSFGGLTGIAVLLASLYRLRIELQASRRQLARKEAELTFALEVQRALFPRQLPEGGGLEFSAVCIPARGISGDYYDVMQLPDGRLALAVADISGKGISAAILMANVQAVLRTITQTARSPQEVCAALNYHLHQVTDAAKFATFFYAEWNADERRLCYVNAGHHPPILLGSNCGKRLDSGGFPLGLFGDAEFLTGELTLEPEDLLVLYSDGITEAESTGGEEFGEHRLQRAIEESCAKPLSEIQASVLEAVRKWSGSSEPQDDMTLLIVRATGAKEEE